MAFELSFAEDFFSGTESPENIDVTERPTSILQGLVSWYYNDIETFKEMVKEVLNFNVPDYLPERLPYALLDKARLINTCTSLESPVSVWLDDGGYYTIEVYDRQLER